MRASNISRHQLNGSKCEANDDDNDNMETNFAPRSTANDTKINVLLCNLDDSFFLYMLFRSISYLFFLFLSVLVYFLAVLFTLGPIPSGRCSTAFSCFQIFDEFDFELRFEFRLRFG